MAAEKITKALKKALFRLEAIQENQEISILDRELIGKLLLEAYEELWSYELFHEEEHPGRNDHFEFDVESTSADEKTSSEKNIPKKQKEENNEKEVVADSTTVEDQIEIVQKETEETQGDEGSSVQPNEDARKSAEESQESPQSIEIDNGLQEIFAVKQSQELSERLSQLPIDDIWSAMGLNERIFTQNELFGGNHEDFKNTVQQLNELNTFEEAKKLLAEGAAAKYEWASDSRAKIAKNFIRLINRKYQS